MAIRSQRLAAGDAAGSYGVRDLYVCPADTTTLLKRLYVMDLSGAAVYIDVGLLTPGGTLTRFIRLGGLAANQALDFETWSVLEAGDKVQYVGANQISYWLSGAELTP